MIQLSVVLSHLRPSEVTSGIAHYRAQMGIWMTRPLRDKKISELQTLHDRLHAIEQGQVASFHFDLAGSVLSNAGKQEEGLPLAKWPWPIAPTRRQLRFVEMALANAVSWLWGPPGTGKTGVLSPLANSRVRLDRDA